jgi:hypothetical protein
LDPKFSELGVGEKVAVGARAAGVDLIKPFRPKITGKTQFGQI